MGRVLFFKCLLLTFALLNISLSWCQSLPFVVPSGASALQPPAPPCPSNSLSSFTGTTLVIAEGSIGDRKRLNFLVDTGAYPSVIDQKSRQVLA